MMSIQEPNSNSIKVYIIVLLQAPKQTLRATFRQICHFLFLICEVGNDQFAVCNLFDVHER